MDPISWTGIERSYVKVSLDSYMNNDALLGDLPRPLSFLFPILLTLLFHSVTNYSPLRSSIYAFSISRLDSTRSINGRMPSSLEIAKDSSSSDLALARSPSPSRSRRASA